MEIAKGEDFHKRFLELEIFQWMPFKQVGGLYHVVPFI